MRLSILSFALAVSVLPLGVEAQQPEKVSRIGVLTHRQDARWAPFLEGLRQFGYVEGKNIFIEWRPALGRAERFPDLAADLVRLKSDVIVAIDNPAIAAARGATKTIPIVMVLAADPVGTGFVASLGRPGGNVTGLTFQATELQGKALELLKAVVPSVSRVAVLWDPTEPGRRLQASEAEVAARALGLQVQLVEARGPMELDRVFRTMVRDGVGAVLVHPSGTISSQRKLIEELAARSRLPTMSIVRWFPEAGGLMSFGARDADLFLRAAHYVDKILKGATPSDLPVEQPTRFELVINLKTAKALDLTIPASLLLRADQVIE